MRLERLQRLFAPIALSIAAGFLAACASAPPETAAGFSARPTVPRLAVVDPDNLTEAQRAMLASRSNLNIYRTLAHHTELYNRWSPLGQFILNGSSISPRHREMAMLRMGWLSQSEYEWAQHARIAKASAGLTDADLRAIAVGPGAEGWSPTDRAVLRMVDELRFETMISDRTWTALKDSYTEPQIMELLFTAAQYQLVSMALNTLGVQLEPTAIERLPTGLPMPATAWRPTSPRLAMPRIAPLTAAQWTPDQRVALGQRADDPGILDLYSTIVAHPRIYQSWLGFMGYVFGQTSLPPKTREMLILRTGWLWNAEYEFAHHRPLGISAGMTDAEVDRVAAGPDAPGWTEEERLVLRAADELRRQAFITDETYAALSRYYQPKQIVELVYTVGGYAMTALAINSLGIQTEPGYTGFP